MGLFWGQGTDAHLGISGERGLLSGLVVPSRQPRELDCFGTCPNPPQILLPLGGRHFMPQLPAGTPLLAMRSLVLASPLTSPYHGPLYTPGYGAGSWLALRLAAPESHGHIGLMSDDPTRKYGCLGLPFLRGCGPGYVFDTEYKSPAEPTRVVSTFPGS